MRLDPKPPRIRHRSRWPLLLLALLAAALLGYGLYARWGGMHPETQQAKARPAPVVVADAQRQDVPRVVHTIGTVMAAATVQVKSRVDGQIVEVAFREGQTVQQGELLFRIDPRPFQATLDQANATLARDKAQLENARADLARYGDLSRRGFASDQKFEQTQAQAKSLTATVAADEAAVTMAKLQLGFTEIRSPITGKTGPLLLHAGNLVKANDANSLVTIAQIQPVRVTFTLPQQDLPEVQQRLADAGIMAAVSIPGAGQSAGEGPIDFIGNAVDAATGTIEMRATLDNAAGRLVPGQFVDVGLRLAVLRDAVTVPRVALNSGQAGRFVWVVKPDGTAEDRPVTVAYENGDIAALDGGIQPGEKVVTDGQLRLARGVSVMVKRNAGDAS